MRDFGPYAAEYSCGQLGCCCCLAKCHGNLSLLALLKLLPLLFGDEICCQRNRCSPPYLSTATATQV